jgi:L-ribulose-5-phosphate 4-epimerase
MNLDGAMRELCQAVLDANLALPGHRLVTLTWGNVSGVDRERGLMAIKPSGIGYDAMRLDDVVVLDFDGAVVAGVRRPSIDTPTHLELYRQLPEIGGIVHTHSIWATAWAQAGREIPLLGTTHADLSRHPVPVTRALSAAEVESGYEGATGAAIAEAVGERPALEVPCVLVRGHAPFCWGRDPLGAVDHAVTLEAVARMALLTQMIHPDAPELPAALRDKHHERKHGPAAYYGQS